MHTGMLSIVVGVLALLLTIWLNNTAVYLRNRSYDLERQDMGPEKGDYEMSEYEDMMRMLAEFNTVDPGGYNSTLYMFDKLVSSPKSILEIGKELILENLQLMKLCMSPNTP
jgi:hypothetical protein